MCNPNPNKSKFNLFIRKLQTNLGISRKFNFEGSKAPKCFNFGGSPTSSVLTPYYSIELSPGEKYALRVTLN